MKQQKFMNFYQKDCKLKKRFKETFYKHLYRQCDHRFYGFICNMYYIISLVQQMYNKLFDIEQKLVCLDIFCRYMAEMLSIRRKTLCNQSINQSRYFLCCWFDFTYLIYVIIYVQFPFLITFSHLHMLNSL